MAQNVLAKQLLNRAALLAGIAIAYWVMHGAVSFELTVHDSEGLTTLIVLMGNIYAVMYAFVIFVIWGQFTDVEKFVMRECYSLDDLLRFSQYMNPDLTRAIRRCVSEYAKAVLQSEWQTLGRGSKDPTTETAFTTLMAAVIRGASPNPAEETIHQRLIDIAREAGDHRDERLSKSLTRIPPTLKGFVNAIAAAMLVLVFFYPFHHPLAGTACFALLAGILILANLVLTDLDNPFNGVYNVNPEPFSRLTR